MRRGVALAIALLAGAVALGALGQAGWIWAKAWAARGLMEIAWSRAQPGEDPPRPWPWADSGPVARLTIPALDADRLILRGADGRALAFGPTLMDGGGPARIVFGHRDTHFQVIADLGPGDRLDWTGPDGAVEQYRVAETAVLRHDALTAPGDGAEGEALLLITCYPFDALLPDTPWRFVVLAWREPHVSARAD